MQTVRRGDLDEFLREVEAHKSSFESDGNLSLVNRLRYNVIKFGLKKVNMAYSKISLEDITSKLGLGSIQDTEGIVAKAIRDGVVDAQIDHERGFVKTREVEDVYTSNDP